MKQLTVVASTDFIDRLSVGQWDMALSELWSILTDGSRSTKIDLGTHFPFLVSEKNVLKEFASPTISESGLGRPSGFRPCSSRYLRERDVSQKGVQDGSQNEEAV